MSAGSADACASDLCQVCVCCESDMQCGFNVTAVAVYKAWLDLDCLLCLGSLSPCCWR